MSNQPPNLNNTRSGGQQNGPPQELQSNDINPQNGANGNHAPENLANPPIINAAPINERRVPRIWPDETILPGVTFPSSQTREIIEFVVDELPIHGFLPEDLVFP